MFWTKTENKMLEKSVLMQRLTNTLCPCFGKCDECGLLPRCDIPKMVNKLVEGFELGDVNRDSKLNIRDATLIQKALAKLESLDDEQLTLADYLTDGKVNIKDATQIQKKIANII